MSLELIPARTPPSAAPPPSVAPPSRSSPRWAALLITVIGVIGGGLWLVTRGGADDGPDRAETPTRLTHSVLETHTAPAGAAMLIDGEWACVTPCRVELPRTSEPRALRFRLDGYEEASREVLLGSALVRVPLVQLTPKD